jgi:hypothetical protein
MAKVSQLEPSLDRAWINHQQQQVADEYRRFYSGRGRASTVASFPLIPVIQSLTFSLFIV